MADYDEQIVEDGIQPGIAGDYFSVIQIHENLKAALQGPSSGAPNMWGAHGPFIDVTTGLTEGQLITGFDKLTLGPAGSEVDFPIWYWDLYFEDIGFDSGTGRSMQLLLSKDGGGTLGTVTGYGNMASANEPYFQHFRIYNFGKTGTRAAYYQFDGSSLNGVVSGSGEAFAATSEIDWNELQVTISAGSLLDAGKLTRRAVLYPAYLGA